MEKKIILVKKDGTTSRQAAPVNITGTDKECIGRQLDAEFAKATTRFDHSARYGRYSY